MAPRRGHRAAQWPPPGGPYRDERLAFFAARRELGRRARRRGGVWSPLSFFFAGLLIHDLPDSTGQRPGTRRRMWRLMVACNEAAAKLDAFERQKLRAAGELPYWFFGEVERLTRKRGPRFLTQRQQ